MQLAIFCFLQLLPVVWANSTVGLITLVLSLAILLTQRKLWPKLVTLVGLLLLLIPLYQLLNKSNQNPPPLEIPPVDGLLLYSQFDEHLPAEVMSQALQILNGQTNLANPEAADLFDSIQLPPHVSLSLLSLNMVPITWVGQYFQGEYNTMDVYHPTLTMKDGRMFYATLMPLPNETEAQGFLVAEVMLLSEHKEERANSWFGKQDPAFLDCKPLVVEGSNGQLLLDLASALDVPPPPYDIHLIAELANPVLLDLAMLFWAMLLLTLVLYASRELGKRRQGVFTLACLLLLLFPVVESRDAMSMMASYVFGTSLLGGLLASPLRFLLSTVLLFLLLQSAQVVFCRNKRFWGVSGFLLILVVALMAPAFLQTASTFSFVHPLEAFSSPGAAASYTAFLFTIAALTMLLSQVPALPWRHKLPVIGAVILIVATTLSSLHLYSAISLCLLWVFKDLRAGTTPKAALAVLCFYPYLVLHEQAEEVSYVKHQLLDEITLLGERNYFRMGRIIQRLPDLLEDVARSEHPHLMELFARRCGLLENEVDFSLSLVGPDNRVISELNHHLTANRLRALSSPADRIESYAGGTEDSSWMSFRSTLPTDFGDYDFTVLLGNDYQNLSLVRAPRTVSNGEVGSQGSLTPYFAYIFEVFDDHGRQLYSQGTNASKALHKSDMEKLEQEPVFWRVNGRNTVFFIKDKDTIYRITHKATPLKMIFARFLSLWLGMFSLCAVIQLAQRPGRGLVSRWRRSFTLQLATVMFLASVLPTSTLGYFLIHSIQKNQAREELSFAQARMLAARNLFRGLGESGSDALPGRGPDRGLRSLPLENYSRILGEDLSLYVGGTMINTNQPEMYRMGIMNRRLPFSLALSLLIENTPFVLERASTAGKLPTVAYASVPLGLGREGVLAMTIIPFSQRQQMRWLEQLEFSLSILFGVLFLMAMFTRSFSKSFLQPVSAITRSAARMAKGLINSPIEIGRQDELERMVAAFNTMQKQVQTSQNQLRQQLRLLDETVGSMSSGLLGFDSNGRLIMENAIAWKLLQLGTHTGTLAELVAAEQTLEPLAAMFQAGHNDEFDFQLSREGEVRQIIGKVRMVKANKQGDVRCILALEDITDAMAANRFKAWSEMARRVAHEIKNPLTPIQLEIDYLNKLYHDGYPEFGTALEEATVEIRSQVEHLKHIATEFSDYARPLQLQLTNTNIASLLREILEPYEKTMADVQIVRQIESDLEATVDARLLRRAIHNLVVNAVQAMDENGTLTIKLTRLEDDAVIWVQDTGPGIPVEEHGQVFEAYFSTKVQGSGLGLVIARKYLTSHEGNLTIDSSYRDGTRFVATIPLAGPCQTETFA